MRRVLIIGPSWVGDMVMAQALAKRLIQRGGPVEIHMLGPPWALPLVERMPEIAAGHALDVPHGRLGLPERWRVARRLRAIGFDEAVILPRSIKAALVPLFARIPVRRGLLGEGRVGLITHIVPLKAKHGRTVDEFVAMAGHGLDPMTADETPRLSASSDGAAQAEARLGLTPADQVAILCPGAEYGPAKRWPAGHFADLARGLIARGHQVRIIGSGKDAPIAAEIAAGAPGTVDLTGKTRLTEAVDLIAAATVVVTNDSGLMHVAAALDRPVIALFGSSSAERTPPLSPRALAVTTDEDLECRPCFARECRFGHLRCLTGIGAERVAALSLAHAAAGASARSTAADT